MSIRDPFTDPIRDPFAGRYGFEDIKLGNMVVKEYLENEGIKLDRFQQHRRSVKKSAR